MVSNFLTLDTKFLSIVQVGLLGNTWNYVEVLGIWGGYLELLGIWISNPTSGTLIS